jgi:hypothetical protein
MATAIVPDLTFNPEARIQGRYIGKERQPLLVIDNVLKHPESMVRYAAEQSVFQTPSERSNYPGLNGDLPPNYAPELARALRPLLRQGFGIPETEDISCQGFFGLTTAQAGELRPVQCIPHSDSPNPYRLAILHYFCGQPYGGTAFFRHLPTGFESVDRQRYAYYRNTVENELAVFDTPLAYAGSSTPRYQQIDYVDAVFDRLVVYRTTSLHSGIMNDAELRTDPATGRLTANTFIEAPSPASIPGVQVP